jgi:hypothetical protein
MPMAAQSTFEGEAWGQEEGAERPPFLWQVEWLSAQARRRPLPNEQARRYW